MKLTELLRSASAVAETGGSAQQCEALAREAENLSDMVGWANGPIDPRGEWLARLATVQDDLQLRAIQTGDMAIAALNDSLTRLGRAIARHDGDLIADKTGDDDGDDFD